SAGPRGSRRRRRRAQRESHDWLPRSKRRQPARDPPTERPDPLSRLRRWWWSFARPRRPVGLSRRTARQFSHQLAEDHRRRTRARSIPHALLDSGTHRSRRASDSHRYRAMTGEVPGPHTRLRGYAATTEEVGDGALYPRALWAVTVQT